MKLYDARRAASFHVLPDDPLPRPFDYYQPTDTGKLDRFACLQGNLDALQDLFKSLLGLTTAQSRTLLDLLRQSRFRKFGHGLVCKCGRER